MNRFLILIFIMISLTSHAQYSQYRFYRHKPHILTDKEQAEIIIKADNIAYERACNDSIYTKEVMQSYLDYYGIGVENTYRLQKSLIPIINRVVTKGKKIKSEDKIVWKQAYYNFEFSKELNNINGLLMREKSRKDSIENYKKKYDHWSNSRILMSLREYCSHDFSITDSSTIKFLEKYNITFNEQMRLQYLRPNLSDAGDLSESLQEIEDVRNYLNNEFNYDPIHLSSWEYYKKPYSTEEIYNSYHKLYEQHHKLYEHHRNDKILQELDSLVKRWKEITDQKLWEKQFLSENNLFKQRCVELQKVLEYNESHPLKDGVLKIDGSIIPYRVDGDKLVVHGTCILRSVNEQYPNATGARYKSYTNNLKLVVKVENGKAISQTLSGSETVWDQNENVSGRSYYERHKKMLSARPVVAMTHQVNYTKYKFGETTLYMEGEWDQMQNKLHYVFQHAFLRNDSFSISKLCKKYLEDPSEYTLKRIRMPFATVDISAIATRDSWEYDSSDDDNGVIYF